MKYQTLIFDLDGTISDPFVGISRSINFALDALSHKTVDPETVRPMIGPPLDVIFETFLGPQSAAAMQQLIDKYRERYKSIGYSENRLYDGMPEIIGGLASMGYRLGVCTAKREDYARKIVEHFALDKHFSFIDGGGVGTSKTEQIDRIIKTGIDPATAVMIGDRAGDIIAAKTHNVHSIGVLWGFGDRAELESAEADTLVSAPQELQSLFL